MALSPQHVAELLDFDEVAYLLEGLDPERAEEGLYPAEDLVRIPKWQRVMADAIQGGSLKVDEGVCVIISKSMSSEAEEPRVWPEDRASLDFYDPRRHELIARLRRQDVYFWLKSSGSKDDDVPKALQPTPTAEGEPAQASEVDDVKAIEVLGLLVEALSQRHQGLYGSAKKPNRAGVVSIMRGTVEGYQKPANSDAEPLSLYGFGNTTIDETLKAAIAAWERRKNNQL